MKLDYDSIGALAKELGCRVTDLIALSPQNDPFYAHLPNRKQAAEWFTDLWARFGWKPGSHLRRLHYFLISQDPPISKPNGETYQNTDNDWKYFTGASLSARYLRLIPDGALSDHRNDPPIINAVNHGWASPSCHMAGEDAELGWDFPDLTEVIAPYLSVDDLKVSQPFLVELWVEKSTQNDILVPLATRLHFNLVTGLGETSEVLARQAVERAADDRRPMRILYVSDFDPGGRSMPVALARKIEFWLREFDIDLDITLDPIILTPQQCDLYRLPRTPLKDERRGAKFEQRFGAGATELDALEALHPGELQRIVESEVFRYLDPTLTSRVDDARWTYSRRVKRAEQEVLENYDISHIEERYSELVDEFRANIETLENETENLWPQIASDLKAVASVIEPVEVPEPRPASPPDAPLFDSRRDALDQIDAYRRWQGRGGAA